MLQHVLEKKSRAFVSECQNRQVDELVVQIASASQEQSLGVNQITQAVSQMTHVTQSNAARAEEALRAARAAEPLDHADKNHVIGRINPEPGSGGAAPAHRQRRRARPGG